MNRTVLAWSVLLMGLTGAACSLLTKPEQGDIKCKISDDEPRVDPCPEGTYCVVDACKPEPEECGKKKEVCDDEIDNDCDGYVNEFDPDEPELCDGIDNNCDTHTDEGHDEDKDGITSCGDRKFGTDGIYDCDDHNKNVYPGAADICDGLNNDCDMHFDEGPNGQDWCDAPTRCSKGSCIKPSCATAEFTIPCGPNEKCIDETCVVQNCQPECKANEVCKQMPTPTCVPLPTKRPNGDMCTTDTDCLSELCIVREALRLPSSAPRSVCAEACCKDSDCTVPDQACFVSGTGTRSCLPKTVAVNTVPVGNPKHCTTNSGPAAECGAGQTCAAALLSANISVNLATSQCRANTSGDRRYTESCNPTSMNVFCASRLCVPGNYFQELCSTPCQSSKDCAELQKAAVVLTSPTAYCQYVDLATYNPGFPRSNYAPICLVDRSQETGAGASGSECTANRNCVDGACIGFSSEGKGRCAPPCCNNAQCMAMKPELRCRPVIRGVGRYELRCL